MLLADFGTTWTKILNTHTGERQIVASRNMAKLDLQAATGHNANGRAPVYVNELTALIQGGRARLGPGPWILVDVGSRDVKLVEVHDHKPVRMEWNNACGAMTGFTLELLGRYFQLDFSTIEKAERALPITCGVLGMERLFDEIASGRSVDEAVARFTCGMANWTHAFMGRPQAFYLSGGMCDNSLFMNSFPHGVDITPLGRFVLVEGLQHDLE